jgi:hypothetical protein
MPSHEFPFVRFQYADGRTDTRGQTYLPIRIINPDTKREAITYALVDTGADSSLFPGKLARQVGHALKGRGVKSSIAGGIEQTAVVTYRHTFRIEILSPDLRRVVWRSRPIEVDCTEANPPVLLGVEGFLEHFKLTIDYPKEKLRLKW